MEWKEMLSRKTLSREKLLAYGFHERKGRLWLERVLSHGFTAVFCVDTDVLQAEIRDEEKLPYLLAEVRSAQGSFVNEVREQTGRHAEQIISACVLQDNREKLLAYAHARYGTSAEYLWEKHPSYGVLRNAKGKWYATFMRIPKRRLLIDEEGECEVVNLKAAAQELVDHQRIFPAYHMNKKHWISVRLDAHWESGELEMLLENSHQLSD